MPIFFIVVMVDNRPMNELIRLDGKTAIVTGAVGIGKGIAYRLAEAGANVVVASLHMHEAEATVAELTAKGLKAFAVQADVSKEDDVKAMVSAAISKYGAVDILVNNAGIFPSTPVSYMQLADFQKVMNTNLVGVFLCTKYCAEEMKKRGKGGRIINITSIDALHPSSIGLAHYDASKHGVWGFTKNVALELAPFNIWVNAVAPGGILTPGVQKMQATTDQKVDMVRVMKEFLESIPMGRMGDPDDIAKVVLFLASDMSSYMTGSQIVVDGGALLK